jgi:hypothetical protein
VAFFCTAFLEAGDASCSRSAATAAECSLPTFWGEGNIRG